MADRNQKPQKSLEDRVRKLENYFAVGVAIATFFGISGGFLAKTVWDAQAKASEAMQMATTAQAQVAKARDQAISAVRQAAAEAVGTEATDQVAKAMSATIGDLRKEIPNTVVVSSATNTNYGGRDGFISCGSGVASGVSFGTVHSDVAASCSTLSLQRK